MRQAGEVAIAHEPIMDRVHGAGNLRNVESFACQASINGADLRHSSDRGALYTEATVPSERPAARTVLRRVADPRRYFETVFGRVDAESRTATTSTTSLPGSRAATLQKR